jgi:hypothetical protein
MAGKIDPKIKVKSTKELTQELKIQSDNNAALALTVKHLEELIEHLKSRLEKSEVEISDLKKQCKAKENGDKPRCGDCNESFESKSLLKKHKKANHKTSVSCPNCEEKFEESWTLEVHLKSHVDTVKHECELCGKCFHMKWRLRKHMDLHNNPKAKKCHFFNNKKHCPFQEVGCKFLHETSEKCYFQDNCRNELCKSPKIQLKHTLRFQM